MARRRTESRSQNTRSAEALTPTEEPRAARPYDIIDLIIPVHNQRQLTLACLAAVRSASVQAHYEIVVVDDASTDKNLLDDLAQDQAAGRITLLTNETNLGFTLSVNRGMRLHTDRDVVLLNNDTLVFDGWLDRLHNAAYSRPRVASVNPLTNASHISCYPYRSANGTVRFEVPDAEISRMAGEVNAGRAAEVHTTVGFCMYIRRQSLNDIGLFDAIHFPVGYGEESDFCYRARRLGWQHLVTGDSFVRHWEGQTFGESKMQRIREMIEIFTRLHSDLAQRDREFAERDPVGPLRARLDLARLRHKLAGTDGIAVVGAGASCQDGVGPHLQIDSESGVMRWSVPTSDTLINLPVYALPHDVARLNANLDYLGVLSLRFADSSLRTWFAERLQGRPFEMTIFASLV